MNFLPINSFKNQLILVSCLFSSSGWKLLVYMAALLAGFCVMLLLLALITADAHAAKSRIKDIVTVEGVRDNLLVGYGLVVGLNGSGDKLNNSAFTEKSLQGFLERLGVNTSDTELKAKNVAAVTVTAVLPPFARGGSRIDVSVATLGDAKSLQGGILVATPLMGADGEVYALAQGAIGIDGFGASSEASGSSISKGVPTSGFVASGAIVEREVAFELNSLTEVALALRNPDISTADSIANIINGKMLEHDGVKAKIARVRDPGTVMMRVPEKYDAAVAGLLNEIEQLEVEPDQVAKIIIDEASGTIVMNENVRIDTVAIAQGNLVIKITEERAVSQPGAFSPEGAQTVEAPVTRIDVDEGKGNKMAVMESGTTLSELVGGLNALGIGPRDLISILQTIKVAGALQAEIEAR